MNKTPKIVFCVVFFALVAAPTLHFFGAKETWTDVYGVEGEALVPPLTFESYTNGVFQKTLTENYSKGFFLRATFLRTAYQLREWSNFGQFHYGYGNSILEGRDGVLFERPYAAFHLACPRPAGKAKYADVLKELVEMNEFCRTNGIGFVFMTMPDKLQAYPEYLPRWLDWFWGYANYDTQGELAGYVREAGILTYDANKYLMDRKADWETWVYPPAGTHFNAYGSGLLYRGFVEQFVDTGKLKLKASRFLGVRPSKEAWDSDDDIGNLLNVWRNPHVANNPHFQPVFDRTNAVLNAGNLITLGDCYRFQVRHILADAKVFDGEKALPAPRGTDQTKNRDLYRQFAQDLRLVIVTFQSYNTGRLDERREELKSIFTAIRSAYEENRKARSGTVVVSP